MGLNGFVSLVKGDDPAVFKCNSYVFCIVRINRTIYFFTLCAKYVLPVIKLTSNILEADPVHGLSSGDT
jgi:hypothetical protein